MKPEQFSDALGLLPDDILAETDALRSQKPPRKTVWWKWACAAACLCLAVFAGTQSYLRQAEPQLPELPLLTISENNVGMGFEGYMAYDISELVNANPWNEDLPLSTLPVFENPITYDPKYHLASGADFDRMREFLIDIAGRFGLDAGSLDITDDAPDEETRQEITEKMELTGGPVPEGYFDPTRLIAETDGLKIEVDEHLTAEISFEPPVALPDGYDFTHYASYESIAAAAEYLKSEYQEVIGMDDPQANIFGGDYNIYKQQSYSIEFFDASGDAVQQIIHYHFNRAAFYCDDNGELFLMRIFQPDLSKKVGDYPIITSKQAEKLLLNGNYITTVPYEMPGAAYVKKVELVYRTGEQEQYYMPYYRFYAEIPELEEDGMKTYGAYYVPAVRSEYLSNMPIWDGSFNS